MNKRQIKKRVKQAKLKKRTRSCVIENWDEFTTIVKGVVDGVRNALADSFQGFADAMRTGGRE